MKFPTDYRALSNYAWSGAFGSTVGGVLGYRWWGPSEGVWFCGATVIGWAVLAVCFRLAARREDATSPVHTTKPSGDSR